jgi:hypothetical protein
MHPLEAKFMVDLKDFNSIPELTSKKRNHHRDPRRALKQYEYYVSYLELERRNDRWVTEDMCKFDEESVGKAL